MHTVTFSENEFLTFDELDGAMLSVIQVNINKCLDFCLSKILNSTLKGTDTLLTHNL